MSIAHLRPYLHRLLHILHTHKIQLMAIQGILKDSRLFLRNHHFIALWPNLGYKHRMSQGKSKPLSLTYRIMNDSFMFSQHSAVFCYEITCTGHSLRHLTLQKGCIISIRHKTDILAVRLTCHRQLILFCQCPDFFLGIFSDRHQRSCQLLLGQVVKGVGLILLGCDGIAYCISSVWKPVYSCIMPCSNIVCTDLHTAGKQRFPLNITVTGITGIRRPACQIFLHKVIHYLILKLSFKIHHIMGNIQCLGHTSCILHGRKTAAASVFFQNLLLPLLPDLHGDSDHIISLFF